MTADPAEQADLLNQSGVAARTLGDLDDAEKRSRRAMELASAAGDKTIATRATVDLTRALMQAFKTAEAGALLDAGLGDASAADERELIEFKLQLARMKNQLEQRDLARQLVEEALAAAERRDFPDLVADGFMLKANLLWEAGRRREAYAVARGGNRLAREHGLTDMVLRTGIDLSGGDIEFDLSVALDGFREMMALARRTGRRRSFFTAVGSLGYAGFLGGAWDEALAEMEGVLADELSASDRMQVLNNAAILRVNRGESVDAELAQIESLAKGMTGRWQGYLGDPLANVGMAGGDYGQAAGGYLMVAENNPGQESEYLYRAASAHLLAGDVDAARKLRAQHADSGGYGRITDARHATLAAGIAAAEGRAAEALPLYREALRDWRAAHAVWDEALTGLAMALLLDPAEPEVAEVIDSAREILTRLDAKPYLEQLDRATSGAKQAARPASAAATEVGSPAS